MTVQTAYSTTHDASYAGQIADMQLANIISKLNKGTAVIPYGKFVVTDGDNGAKLPEAASTAAQINGVVVYEVNRAQATGAVAGAVAKYDFSVMSVGPIWVKAASAVTKDQPVFMRVGATNNGDAANAAGSGATLSVAVPNAKFLTDGAVGALVKISIGLGG